jgi:hypothetical protein
MGQGKFQAAVKAIDAANSKDPKTITVDGAEQPGELVYGLRMSAALDKLSPAAGEHLRLATRAQHIERWKSARPSYPEGKAGYLKWRTDLKEFHASRAGEIMAEAGYDSEDIARVQVLVRKKAIKRDPEAQTLEDTACLVFLEHYAPAFIAKYDDEKVISILAKTARKMSGHGLKAAGKLPLTGRLAELLTQALDAK